MTQICVITEDALSEAVIDRLIEFIDADLQIVVRMGKQGNGYQKRKLPELLKFSKSTPVLLLTDLDRVECAPTLISDWLKGLEMTPNLLFRVAVREVEAWLLADHEAFTRFAQVPASQLPDNPELLDDPKQKLLNLVRKYAKRDIKDSLLPKPGSRSQVGIAYNAALIQYVKKLWQPDRAAHCSDSLARVIPRLRSI